MNKPIKKLAITLGDPSGIGAEVFVKAAQQQYAAELVVFADPEHLQRAALRAGLSLQCHVFNPAEYRPHTPGHVSVVACASAPSYQLGKLSPLCASYVMQCLDAAILACQQHLCDGLVTGPLCKHTIIDAGWEHFRGHTDYLAERCHVSDVVMMLASDDLRIALITTHIPLKEVVTHLSIEKITAVLSLLHSSLRTHFQLSMPRIGVCGINPHAGEAGHLGMEEQTLLLPALERCRSQGMTLVGPLPADTAFAPSERTQFDVIVAMYHDQGLAPFKALSFGASCNITLGLPFLRTSVDHGTAANIATLGIAQEGSFCYALRQHLRWKTRNHA